MKKFDLEAEFQKYLERMGLKKPGVYAPEAQIIQLRMAFMGAIGQYLIYLKEEGEHKKTDEIINAISETVSDLTKYWAATMVHFQSKNN